MPIQFACPHCGEQMTVSEQYAGSSGPCRKCHQTITIPGSSSPFSDVPTAKGKSGMSGVAIALIVIVACGIPLVLILIALLLPAVNAAREAARRNQCINNSKQIALAMLNYEAAHGSLPPAYTVDENGKPLHSWRVLILPFLEQQALYNQIDLTKPWDDPANAILLSSMPNVYRCPSDPGTSTDTNYMVIVGPNSPFPGSVGRELSEITDGISNTVMLVETAGSGVSWADPRDVDQANIMALIDSYHSADIVVVTKCDASTQAMTKQEAAMWLGPGSTVNGQEQISTITY